MPLPERGIALFFDKIVFFLTKLSREQARTEVRR
jgi:hypothetical protein